MRRYILERIYHYSTYLTSWSWQKLYGSIELKEVRGLIYRTDDKMKKEKTMGKK